MEGKKIVQCTIDVWSEKYGWCLECVCNTENAERVLAKKQAQFPNEKFRIDYGNCDNAWWNTVGTN